MDVRLAIFDGVDVDPAEPGLVVVASIGVADVAVHPTWVRQQIDQGVQGGVGIDAGLFKGLHLVLKVGELAGELVLLLAGDVCGHSALEGVLGPLSAVAVDLGDASF